MKLRTIFGVAPVVLMMACGGADDGRNPMGSQQMVTSSDFSALYVANSEHGTISRINPETGAVKEIEIGAEVTRMARADGRTFVTLRDQRKLAVLAETSDGLEIEKSIDVGAEPFGVVVTEDGDKVFVAVSMANEVVEIDGDSLETLRTWKVSDQPRWLAIHPSGDGLYVASAMNGGLWYIDVGSSDAVPQKINLPSASGFDGLGNNVEMARRLTGDPTVTPDGDKLLVPAMYIDNITVVEEGNNTGGGYDAGRFNPVVIDIPLDGEEPDSTEGKLVPVTAFTTDIVNGYPSSVSVSPDGEIALVTIEAARAVVAFPVASPSDSSGGSSDPFIGGGFGGGDVALGLSEPSSGARAPDGFFEEGVNRASFNLFFDHRPLVAVKADFGPRSIAFTSDEKAWVYSFIDRRVAAMDVLRLRSVIDPDSDQAGFFPPNGFNVTGGLEIAPSVLGDEVERGRRLFYSAQDSRMAQIGAGVSCSTCHFDGRNDGLTWSFLVGPRQTPSLAGPVSLTNPVRWEGTRVSVADDAMQTSQGLMGGSGLADSDALAIEAFVDFTRDVDAPLKGDNPAVQRGAEIFNRPDVACSTCHYGPRFTDNKAYQMFGLEAVQTRSLVGVSASAPYLHDGTAKTLKDVLIRARSGEMGNTSSLSDAELDDLEKYLMSL